MDEVEELARNWMAQSTVRISTSSESGTGFWVGPKTVLTCSHVVTDSDQNVLPDIAVEWRKGGQFEKLTATATIAKTPGVDLALLTVTHPPSDHPCAFLLNRAITGSKVTSYGYPSKRLDGGQATYLVQGKGFVDGHALLELKEGQVDFGASGSPVLHDRYRSVCAVLTISRNVDTDLGGIATQVDLAFQEWPDLRVIQTEALKYDRVCNDLLPLSGLQRFQQEERQRLARGELDQRVALKLHPLSPRFSAFANARPWHETIAARFGDLLRAAASVNEWLTDLPELVPPDYSSNYDQILSSLQRTVDGIFKNRIEVEIKQLETVLSRLIRENRPSLPLFGHTNDLSTVKDRLGKLRNIKRMMQELHDEVRNPTFGKCFLVLGEIGSGKTHFISSLLEDRNRDSKEGQSLVIVVRPRQLQNRSILEYLLEVLRARTQLEWSSLAEFLRYMCSVRKSPRLIIAIDDLHTVSEPTAFLDQLKQNVSENTQYHSLYWFIALEHQSYIQITSAARFWNEYGYVDPELKTDSRVGDTTQVGPWVQLDELNYQGRVGLEIVANNLPKDSGTAFAKLAGGKGLTEDILRLMATPFIAWTLVECSELLSESILINLNHAQFLKRYWETMLPRLSSNETEKYRLESAVVFLTTFLVEKGFAPPLEEALVDFVVEKARGKSDLAERSNARNSIKQLERSRTLRTFNNVDDPELAFVRQVDLCFEAFWDWKLGRRLDYEFNRAKKGRSVKFLETWFRQKVGPHRRAIGILEFFLLEQDVVRGEEIWNGAAESTELPTGAIWFAAAKLPWRSRAVVAKRLLRPGLQLRDDRFDLFGMIYFVSSLSSFMPEEIAISDLFHALKPHYAALNAAALGDYFIFTVERFLPKVGTLDMLEVLMLEFDGCEVMGVAQRVANLTIDTMMLFDEKLENSIGLVMQYLSRSLDDHAGKETEKDRSTFQHWLISDFCKTLVNQDEISTFSKLSQQGWYAQSYSQIPQATGRRMKKEANFAFGDWYRWRFPPPIEDYVAMVNSAAHSNNVAEREAAFFMIRHTRATHGGNVKVDRRFVPTLERLFNDPMLGWIASDAKYREFFQVNKVQRKSILM